MKQNLIYILLGISIISVALYKPNYINLVPSKLLNHFKQNNWEIIKTDKDITDNKGIKKSGVINFDTKTITYNNDKTILHEFGHYLDYVCENVSSTNKFKEVYLKEKDKTNFSDYHRSTVDEYFAESFSQYILNKNTDLETYSFIENCLKKL